MAEEKKYEHIVIERVDDGNYAVISMNRPDKLNALTAQTCREVADALESKRWKSKYDNTRYLDLLVRISQKTAKKKEEKPTMDITR